MCTGPGSGPTKYVGYCGGVTAYNGGAMRVSPQRFNKSIPQGPTSATNLPNNVNITFGLLVTNTGAAEAYDVVVKDKVGVGSSPSIVQSKVFNWQANFATTGNVCPGNFYYFPNNQTLYFVLAPGIPLPVLEGIFITCDSSYISPGPECVIGNKAEVIQYSDVPGGIDRIDTVTSNDVQAVVSQVTTSTAKGSIVTPSHGGGWPSGAPFVGKYCSQWEGALTNPKWTISNTDNNIYNVTVDPSTGSALTFSDATGPLTTTIQASYEFVVSGTDIIYRPLSSYTNFTVTSYDVTGEPNEFCILVYYIMPKKYTFDGKATFGFDNNACIPGGSEPLKLTVTRKNPSMDISLSQTNDLPGGCIPGSLANYTFNYTFSVAYQYDDPKPYSPQ